MGRRLLAFAEAEALRRGYCEIRLYTHQTMVENQRLYTSIGYEETGRGTEAGYDRVFMRPSSFGDDQSAKRTNLHFSHRLGASGPPSWRMTAR